MFPATSAISDYSDFSNYSGHAVLAVTRRLLRYKSLLLTLVGRELKARYRGSVLGFLWSLVNPLILLGVYSFVFSTIFSPRYSGAKPYPIFLMTGLFPWIWVSTALLEGTQGVISNAGLIRKAVFPAEILPMVSVLSNLLHLGYHYGVNQIAAVVKNGRVVHRRS